MRPNGFFARLWPLLFGYDFFISYCRDDASKYAEKLNACLRAKGVVCFLDREQTVGGVELAPALRSALRRSRALVVILTPGVVRSPWVKEEVETFLKRRERLIPINVDRFLTTTDLGDSPFAQLRGRSWIDEQQPAPVTG